MSPSFANVPFQWVGPVQITGPEINVETELPLATYETPLFASVNRGARVATASGGIQAVVIDDRMTRSVLFEAPDAVTALNSLAEIKASMPEFGAVVAGTSRFAKLLDMHSQIAGNLLFIRFEFSILDPVFKFAHFAPMLEFFFISFVKGLGLGL